MILAAYKEIAHSGSQKTGKAIKGMRAKKVWMVDKGTKDV